MTLQVGKCLLSEVLKEKNMTPQELAYKLDMPKQQISAYIHNKKVMTLRTAMTIALALGCNIEDLYEWIRE